MTTLAPPKKILTVEDNAIVSADVRTILEGAGYDVCPEAYDGVQAVEHVRAYAPDLILLDLRLPLVDGVETASRIREESDAPILVLTGSNDPELLGRAQAAGTTGHVLKPFSESVLLRRSRTAWTSTSRTTSTCAASSIRWCVMARIEKTIVQALERLHPSHTTRAQRASA